MDKKEANNDRANIKWSDSCKEQQNKSSKAQKEEENKMCILTKKAKTKECTTK